MQVTAKLIQILPLQTGTNKSGAGWKKQDIVVETTAQYPKKICISIWGDKIDKSLLQEGAQLTISFDVESREYNGRWYTDVKAWKVESAGPSPSRTESFDSPAPYAPPATEENDLPF